MDGLPSEVEDPRAVAAFTDSRGTLTLITAEQVPFSPRRTYVLHDMAVGSVRGGHANRRQARLLVGISGRSAVTLDDADSTTRQVALLAGHSLLIGPGVWHEIEVLEVGTVILVFADGDYDPEDLIGDRPAAPLEP
jgi:dTDP-4-dehydrorhamnose 3,5-epimerase-like enzyme